MKQIGLFEFPETTQEAHEWNPTISYRAIHSKVLLVAKTRIEGKWACYCTPVPGKNHDEEKHLWESYGSKVGKSVALAAFPEFDEVPYAL